METDDSRTRRRTPQADTGKPQVDADIIHVKKYQNIKRQALYRAYSLHRKRRQNRTGYAFMIAFATLILTLIWVWK